MASTSANVPAVAAVAVKKTCKNHDSYTYSGKEMSPLGLGYTAEAEEVGTVMEGRDKTMWMVGIKNGVRVWNRIPTQVAATVLKPMEKELPALPVSVPVAEVEAEPVVAPVPAAAPAPVKKKPAKKEVAAPEIVPVPPTEPVVAPVPAPAKKKPVKKEVAAVPAVPPVPPVVEPPVVDAVVPAAAPAKKKPVKKVAEQAPQIEENAAPAAAPKKKAPPKKKAVDNDKPAAAEPEKKRATAFNVYMSFRTFQLKTERPDLDHKLRFKQAADEWKLLSDDDKKNALAEAKKWADEKNATAA